MFRNRFFSTDFELSSGGPWLSRAAFLLNLFPPYNKLCSLWALFCGRCVPTSKVAQSVSERLMRHGFLFGALRHLSPEDRTAFANAMVLPTKRREKPLLACTPAALEAATRIGQHGFAHLGSFSASDPRAVVEYFRAQNGYRSQVPLQSDGVLRQFDVDTLCDTPEERYFCFSARTSLACPQIRQIADSAELRQVAAAYLGFVPELFSVNTMATIKGTADHYVMRMHRDQDAFASLTFFVYWTDVGPKNGATIFIPGSHLSSKADRSQQVSLSGRAGDIFALDTFGLHAGNSAVESFRLATWFRFGSSPNLATIQDPALVPR
jgi:hypothetical protein